MDAFKIYKIILALRHYPANLTNDIRFYGTGKGTWRDMELCNVSWIDMRTVREYYGFTREHGRICNPTGTYIVYTKIKR